MQQTHHTAIKAWLTADTDDDGAHLDGTHNRHGCNAWLGSQDCFRDCPAAILDELQVLLFHNLEQVVGCTWNRITVRGWRLQSGLTEQPPMPSLFVETLETPTGCSSAVGLSGLHRTLAGQRDACKEGGTSEG